MAAQAQSPHLIVVGGGAIGLAIAFGAARRGLRPLVLDAGEPGAWRVAAGMLAPVAEAEPGEDAVRELGLASARRYPGWVAEVEAESGLDSGYRACGTLLVARDGDEAEALEHLLAFRARLGLDVERLLPSAARGLEPALARTARLALHLPGDHAIDPRALVRALRAAVARAGGAVREGARVTRVAVAGDRVEGVVLEDGERVTAPLVVLAAGVWSARLEGLPDDARVPLRPVKGQTLRLRDPRGPGLVERVVRTPRAYLVPRADGSYVLGATVEERGWDTSATAGGLFELLRDISEVVPGVLELELESVRVGLRPGTPDNAPAIGPAGVDGLHWATGHYRHGILLAPVTADLVVGLLAGDPPSDLAALVAPERFAAKVPA